MQHTEPALADRRRPLKPLLARFLAGEPWHAALCGDPRSVEPSVTAACLVSSVSRRDPAWVSLGIDDLPPRLIRLVKVDRAHHPLGQWPFLDALERLLPTIEWPAIAIHLAPYREVWKTSAQCLDGRNQDVDGLSASLC